jgi:hypothetical protein
MRNLVRRGRLLGVVFVLTIVATACYHANTPYDGGPLNDPVTTESFRIGPYDLAGVNEPGWEVKGNRTIPRPSGNVAIKRVDFNVVDGDGNDVPIHMVHLHHIVVSDQGKVDAICGGGARFTGTGLERTPTILWGDYAYLSSAGSSWRANFHLHTTTSMPAEDVFIEYTIQYESYTDPSEFRGTTPYFLDVTGCGQGSIYDVPGDGGPGSVHTASRTYTAPDDGIAVFAGGHVHTGGLDASLTRDATGEDYCTATAHYTPTTHHPFHPNHGTLHRISHCLMHSEVNAGETFTLRARYDNEIPLAKTMGIILTHVWHPDS